MATRRPKVPKAASRRSATPEPAKEATDGADVIRAHFGGAEAAGGAAPRGSGAARKDTPTPATRTGVSRAVDPTKGATPQGSAKAAVHDDAPGDGRRH